VIDLVAGQVSVLFTAIPTAVTQVRAGRLRAVAVTGPKRVDAVKELPTVAETLPGFESSQWWGMLAPPGTAADIVDKLNAEVGRMLVDADVKARFANEGADAIGGSPRDFIAYMRADYEKWGRVVRAAGISPD
jgi:tripartite-type tricarboxylate transporter receptor subunit TctC